MDKKDALKGLLAGAMKYTEKNEDDAKKNLQILEEFKNLIPPLKEEELNQLKNNILQEGCREPLLVWYQAKEKRYILVDGHNRYGICQNAGINFKIKFIDFENSELAMLWMVNNQLGRRNLSLEQTSYLRGKRYAQEKAIIKNPQGKNGILVSGHNDHQPPLVKNDDNREDNLVSGHNDHQPPLVKNDDNKEDNLVSGHNDHQPPLAEKTAKLLAKEYGIGEKTIRRDAQFAKGIDLIGKENPELKKEILSGKVKINKNQIQALAKIDSFPKIESIDQIADILKADKPVKKESKTDLEIAKVKITKILKEMNLSLEQKQELREFLANYPLF